jgi:uncharacterized integral membrane protein (TIGR00698 family)
MRALSALADQRAVPGVLVSATVAVAAMFLSQHYGASAMLFALLLGMALNFLSQEGKCVQGIQASATTVLRLGVALLGLRISVAQVTALGLTTVLLVVVSVALTILLGIALARLCSLDARFGVLTAGAVAICGASAALAISAVLPRHANSERDVTLAVIGVTTLSTVAMIAYPIIISTSGMDHRQTGVFLGATIHDVAQVVGAGYSVSEETGDSATIVKLLRVLLLLPVLLLVSLGMHLQVGTVTRTGEPLLPWFAVAFAVLVLVNSTGSVPPGVTSFADDLSRWCLVTAIAAIGMKTSLKELAVVGPRPVVLMILQTLLLALLVAALIAFGWARA